VLKVSKEDFVKEEAKLKATKKTRAKRDENLNHNEVDIGACRDVGDGCDVGAFSSTGHFPNVEQMDSST